MRRITSLAITCAFIACFSAFSIASTVQVGGCLVNVTNYSSIQVAINAAGSGGIVKVCPGNYYEQLLITQPLTLTGVVQAGKDLAVIYPPAGGLVQNTTDARGAVAAQ